MKKIIILTKMSIKEFYQELPVFNNKKLNKKSVFFWLICIILFGVLYLSNIVINYLAKSGNEEIFLEIFLPLLASILIFQTVLICANILFFAKDIEYVVYMPFKPTELLMARFNILLSTLYVTELIIGLVPITLYGLETNVGFLFYIWEAIIFVLFPVCFTFIICGIMIIIINLTKFIKNNEQFQICLSIFFIILLILLETGIFKNNINNVDSVEQEITIDTRIKNINKYFLIINPTINILKNENFLNSLIYFIKILIYNLIAGMLFLASGYYTYKKILLRNIIRYNKIKKTKIKFKKIRNKNIAYIIKEMKTLLREPVFFIQCIFPLFIVMICSFSIGKILFSAIIVMMQSDVIGEVIETIEFNYDVMTLILIVLQVLYSIEILSLTAISREGKTAIINKCIPVSLYKQFLIKNIPQVLINTIIMTPIIIVFINIFSNDIFKFIGISVIGFLMNLINSYIMIIIDLKKPNIEWNSEYEVVKNSTNRLFQYVLLIISIIIILYLKKLFEVFNLNINLAICIEIAIYFIMFILIDIFVRKNISKLFKKIN